MRKIKNAQKYIEQSQTPAMEEGQIALAAIDWNEYHVCYRDPVPTSDGAGSIIWAMAEDGEMIVIKKMPLTHVTLGPKGKKGSRQIDTHQEIYSQTCKHIPEKRRFKQAGNFLFFATEYVEHDFKKLKGRRMSGAHGIDDVLNAFVGFSHGLEFIHNTAGVVHRDLKPSNLRFDIVDNEIVPKIIDFGLACGKDVSLSITGTVGYMAPELQRDGFTSDIYSLGVCLYEAISQEQESPVNDQQTELINTDKQLQEEHAQIDSDKSLEREEKQEARNKANIRRFHEVKTPEPDTIYIFEIFKKATQPEPKDRYQSATKFKQDLQIALQRKRLDEIIIAFDNASKVSEKIKKGITFDLALIEEASRLKEKLYAEFEKDGISTQESTILQYVEAQIQEKTKPIKEAVTAYFRRFRFTGPINREDLSDEQKRQIDMMLDESNNAYKRNILEIVTKLKRFYKLCGINEHYLFDMLLESRALKHEALQSRVHKSYNQLMQKTEELDRPTLILPEGETYSEAGVISARLDDYLASLSKKEAKPLEIQRCIEIKELLEREKDLNSESKDPIIKKLAGFLEQIENYISQAPKEVLAQTFFNMGAAAFNKKDFKGAITQFEEARKLCDPNPFIEYNIGLAHHVLGERRAAKAQYTKANTIRRTGRANTSIPLLNNRGVLLAIAEMPDQARELLEIAAAQDPNDLEITYNLAVVCSELGDSETAVKHFEKVLSVHPSDELHNLLFQEYFKLQDFAKAQEHCIAYAESLKGRIPQTEDK